MPASTMSFRHWSSSAVCLRRRTSQCFRAVDTNEWPNFIVAIGQLASELFCARTQRMERVRATACMLLWHALIRGTQVIAQQAAFRCHLRLPTLSSLGIIAGDCGRLQSPLLVLHCSQPSGFTFMLEGASLYSSMTTWFGKQCLKRWLDAASRVTTFDRIPSISAFFRLVMR